MIRRVCLKSNDVSATVKPSSIAAQEQTIANCGGPSVRQMRRHVLQAVKQGDYSAAIAGLNQLLASYPRSAEDYSNRGLVYWWSGQPGRALHDFNRAIALNASLAGPYNNRANYYAAQGDHERAIADYEQAIDLDPFHVRARINRAITLRELRDYDAALHGFDEALAFRQLTGEIYAERGRTYHLRGDWNSAISDYRRALKFFPGPTGDEPLTAHTRWQQIVYWLSQLQPRL